MNEKKKENEKMTVKITETGEILINNRVLFSNLEQAIQWYLSFIQIKYSETVILFILKEGKVFKLMEIGEIIEDMTNATSAFTLKELTASLKKEISMLPETEYLIELTQTLESLLAEKQKNLQIVGNFIEELIALYNLLEENRPDRIDWRKFQNHYRLLQNIQVNPYRTYVQKPEIQKLKELSAIVRDGNFMEAEARLKTALDILAPLYPLEITFPLGSQNYELRNGILKPIEDKNE